MVRTQVPSYAGPPAKADAALESPRSFLLPKEKKVAAAGAPPAPQLSSTGQDVNAMQDEIKALEAQLARAREQDNQADPDGEYVDEVYEEEVYDDGDEVYEIEEIVDDGTEWRQGEEYDEEIIEVEYDEDEEYEEVIEEEEVPVSPGATRTSFAPDPEPAAPPRAPAARPPPPAPAAPAARPPNPLMGGGGDGRSALMAAIRGAGGADGGGEGGAPALKPVSSSPSPAAPKKAGAPKAASLGGSLKPAPPRQQNTAPGGRPNISLNSVKLKPTGINLAEPEAASPYTPQGPPPKPQPARGPPPKAQPARDAPKPGEKPKNFLGVATEEEKAAAAAEAKAHKAQEAEAEAQPRKKWIPMKDRNPEKYPKNSMEAREMPKKKTTKLAPLPFRQRQYPKVNPSDGGKETAMEKMLGPYLYKNVKMEHVTVNAALQGQDIVCLYFGASWRAGCKAFQQQIIDFYKLTNKDCNVECVYISADRTLFEFKDVYQKFPFLAMPTGTVDLKNKMTQDFKITDMPVLVVLNAQTGHLITIDGVEEVSSLPSRDRDAAQNLANEWKTRKAAPVGRGGGGGGVTKKAPAAKSGGSQSKASGTQEQAPPAAPQASPGKSVGRKEKKGLLFWKKQ